MKTICVFILLLSSLMAHADSMRCDQSLVSTGDPLFMAEEKCGPPSDKKEYTSPATYTNRHGHTVIDHNRRGSLHQIWTYNFGPDRLMMRLYAINNTIERIETLSYGK